MTTKTPAKKKTAATKTPAPKVSLYRTTKVMLIKSPNLPLTDLVEGLRKAGYTPNVGTVATLRADTRNTLEVLVEAGLLDIELT